MKKAVLVTILLSLFLTLFLSGEESPATVSDALKKSDVSVGGYGALRMKFTGFDKNAGFITDDSFFGYLIGARGGITFNGKWTIGAAFSVLANKFHYRCHVDDKSDFCAKNNWDNKMVLGYGGGYFSYFFEIRRYIGIETGFLAGGGSLKGRKEKEDYWDNDKYSEEDHNFFVFEPEVELVVKFTNYFGMGLGFGYRVLAITEKLSAYDLKDMSGPFISFDARLGVF